MKQEETNAVRGNCKLSILTVDKCASQDVVDEALKSVERVFHLALLQVCRILLGKRGVTCEIGIDGGEEPFESWKSWFEQMGKSFIILHRVKR